MVSARTNKTARMISFYKNYEQNILPVLEQYEQERRNEICRAFKYSLIALPTTIVAIWILCWYCGTNIFASLDIAIASVPILLGGCGLAIFAIFFNQNFEYKNKIKNKLMGVLISSFGEIEWFSGKDLISDSEIQKSKLFGKYNSRTSDDAFKGIYEGVPFRISETTMVDEVRGRKFYAAWRSFKGIVIAIKSNKKIKAQTIVTTKGDINTNNFRAVYLSVAIVVSLPTFLYCENIMFSFIITGVMLLFGVIFCIIDSVVHREKKKKNLQKVVLEDVEFNKKYNTYSVNQVEGRYLITTAFMHRFKNLHTVFGTRRAKCAFFANEVMFALPTRKNLFELSNGLFCSLKNPKRIRAFYEEISAIYDIIDYFKLAEKTGL